MKTKVLSKKSSIENYNEPQNIDIQLALNNDRKSLFLPEEKIPKSERRLMDVLRGFIFFLW